MLKIVILGKEVFNEETSEVFTVGDIEVELEHSLLSLSKWESKYQKPFLSNATRTPEEIFGYLQAMVNTPGMDPDVLLRCSQKNIDAIQAYIDSPETATTFGMMPERRGPGEVITSELIYYWMTAFSIPWEAQTWHLNRLFALIRICNIKNASPKEKKRLTQQDILSRRELNEQRKRELGSRG